MRVSGEGEGCAGGWGGGGRWAGLKREGEG